MSAEITMPQLSDTMTDGTVVKWHKKEGDPIKPGDVLADVETDKATMPMEAFEAGTLAVVLVREGQKVKVGKPLGIIATGSENPAEIKQKYSASAASAEPAVPTAPAKSAESAPASPTPPAAPKSPDKPKPAAARARTNGPTYDWDLVVIGGGPAGYAAAIRAGQLKKRVLCIEKESLGGTCLNWGCIPTKALLDDGAFIRKLRLHSAEHGVHFKDLTIDFAKLIARSRMIAEQLSQGIEHLFRKYEVKRKSGVGQLLGPHKVRIAGPAGPAQPGGSEVTADHIILAAGARAAPLPFAPFDGKRILASREAMSLTRQPARLAIIGAGAIGCEFADFYNAVGTEITIIEMLDHLLPNEDQDVSLLLERVFTRRKIDVRVKTRVEKVETSAGGAPLTLGGEKPGVVEADVVLVATGVVPNTEDLAAPGAHLDLVRGRVKVDPNYHTNIEDVWAVGDCIAIQWPDKAGMDGMRHPDLAHVAHHEAIRCVENMVGTEESELDYRNIPACTYTHPQVASMGLSEIKARELYGAVKVGKFPYSASGRALAMGEPDGFVKLIFAPNDGELIGCHMIGENVTDMLAELVLAHKLEATEAEIITAIHPHPTFSEVVMEAAGVSEGRSIHL